MTETTPRRPRLAALCLLPLLMLPGLARAACGNWSGQNSLAVLLTMPAALTLTTQSAPGDVLASGDSSISPLTCDNALSVDWQWGGGSDAGNSLRQLAPGIGLRLKWTALNGGMGWLPSSGGTATTQGLNWTNLHWELVRLAGTVTAGQTISGGYVATGTLTSPDDGTQRNLIVNLNNSVAVTATCALTVDKSQVTLPDTDASALSRNGSSASVPLNAYVTCPADTTLASGTRITLSTTQADTTDNTLVGSLGGAQGVAIEVLDSRGGRISAQGGVVTQAAFTQGSSTASPGATQALGVRLVRQSGKSVTAGTVQGVFTLTLSVN